MVITLDSSDYKMQAYLPIYNRVSHNLDICFFGTGPCRGICDTNIEPQNYYIAYIGSRLDIGHVDVAHRLIGYGDNDATDTALNCLDYLLKSSKGSNPIGQEDHIQDNIFL